MYITIYTAEIILLKNIDKTQSILEVLWDWNSCIAYWKTLRTDVNWSSRKFHNLTITMTTKGLLYKREIIYEKSDNRCFVGVKPRFTGQVTQLKIFQTEWYLNVKKNICLTDLQ